MSQDLLADASANARQLWKGRALIVCAAVLWSTSGFFAKAPLFADWSGPVLAFWRATFASVLLVPNVRRPRWSWGLIPMVAAFAAMNYTYLSAMAMSEASLAIWLQNTAPAWVLLFGVLWLREPVRRSDWVLFLMAGLGVGIILRYELRGAELQGVLFGLAAGVAYAAIVLMLRRLRDLESFWLIALNHVGTAIVLAPLALTSSHWPSGIQWLYLAAFGMLQMALPYVLFARGLQAIPGHEAAAIALLEPLLVPVWVFLAWRHHPTYQPPAAWTLVGGACILLGLAYRVWSIRSQVAATRSVVAAAAERQVD